MLPRLLLVLSLTCGCFPAWAALITYSQLCPSSAPPDAFATCQFSGGSTTTSDSLNVSYPGLNPDSDPAQVFSASAWADATPTMWRISLDLSVENYLRSNYVFSTAPHPVTGEPNDFIATTGVSAAQLTDGVTVTGGTGVYSLNYILGVEGMLSGTGSALVSIQFCAQLALPEGTGTFTSSCTSLGELLPSTVTLSYADLPFGGPLDPTLYIALYATVAGIFPDSLESIGNDLVTGSVSGQFGSTVTLLQLTATDPNGNPIPGLSLYSSNGYEYPTDPSNLVLRTGTPAPAPGSALLIASGIALLALRRRQQRNSGRHATA